MSTRISVLAVNHLTANQFSALTKRISAEAFDSSTNSGFLINRQSNSSVEGRYVQKISGTVKVVDPLGETLEFPRVVFLEQRFQLTLKSPQLILFNPGSALQSMLGRLLEFSDFKMSAEPIDIPLTALVKQAAIAFSNVRVYAANVEPFPVNSDTTIRLSVESSGDARAQAKGFLKSRSVEFGSLKCEFEHGSRVRRCEFRRNGVTIYGECDPILEAAFTQVLTQMCA